MVRLHTEGRLEVSNLDSESEALLRLFRGSVIVPLAIIFSVAGSCSFIRWQSESTERACIAAGREVVFGECQIHQEPSN